LVVARQDVVRALVPRERAEEVEQVLVEELGVDPSHLKTEVAEPGVYRDERPDRELRHLVRVGRGRVVAGALIGALLGAVVAFLVPVTRDLAVYTVPLLAFAGAWGGGAVAAARGVQTHRDTGDRPERLHQLGPAEAADHRILTVREAHDRPEVSDRLADLGIVLLDTRHPRVGREEPGHRPAGVREDGAGPSVG
jgi:hypothetical protein